MTTRNAKILQAGLLTGTMDILSAFIYYYIKSGKTNFLVIFKFIASGIFGKTAGDGGTAMILTGFILHYAIAFAFTVFLFWLYPKMNVLSKNRMVTGIVYGLFVWSVMNLVVVPLSNTVHRPFKIEGVLINMGILIICIGLPLSFIANAFYKKRTVQ
ncbi:MAG TPA: hypothetical protein VGH64_05960 [Puia sp.]|jgi:hypothetical protein